ncbi:MAG TPA: XdhC family protein [Gemmatimonadota bacterium]|nr:XdhC family protein [Gemmatimonadota bacterium]
MSEVITAVQAARRALSAQLGGEPVATVSVIDAPVKDTVGRRMLVTAGATEGSLGSRERDERAAALAREALVSGERQLHEVELEGGTWQLYVEPQSPIPDLLIIGAGHIARPLCRLGALLGFRVTVADDRPEFANRQGFPEAAHVELIDFADPFTAMEITANSYVVLVTRGHKYDYDCILQLLKMNVQPAYLGMIGSRRRVRAAFEALVADGADPERLRQVHAPIGLDIGSETPEEIALAIAAEIVAVRRGGSGGRLSEQESVLDRVTRRGSKPSA